VKILDVSKSSEDVNGDCTALDPCRTIQRALLAAADGDRIEISHHNYDENLMIDKSVTLHGIGPGPTQITSANTTQRVLTIQDGSNGPVSVTLENLLIWGGRTAQDGAGIFTSASQLRLVNVQVTNNHTSTANGGGIACLTGALSIEKSSIDNNLAYEGGGGIWVAPGCALSMNESAVFLNDGGHAGALWLEGSAQLTNTTISNNSAQRLNTGERAGGIEVWEDGVLSLNHVTLAFNRMELDGFVQASQVWVKVGGRASLTNTLLHGFPDLDAPLCAGELTSGGYNLSQDASCDLTGVGDMPNTDALPVGLSDMAATRTMLWKNSPAIRRGCPTRCRSRTDVQLTSARLPMMTCVRDHFAARNADHEDRHGDIKINDKFELAGKRTFVVISGGCRHQ
jgi:hypothetical protein